MTWLNTRSGHASPVRETRHFKQETNREHPVAVQVPCHPFDRVPDAVPQAPFKLCSRDQNRGGPLYLLAAIAPIRCLVPRQRTYSVRCGRWVARYLEFRAKAA